MWWQSNLGAALTLVTLVAMAASPAMAGDGPFVAGPPLMPAGGSYLGVDVRDVTSERVKELKLPEERGVEVMKVDREAPAGKAGIAPGDVILEFNENRVQSVQQLKRLLQETPAGRTVGMVVWREGKRVTLKPTLADRDSVLAYVRPDRREHIVIPGPLEMPHVEVPGLEVMVRSRAHNAGMTLESLTRQLGQYFGVENGRGVLVRSVEQGSRAESAGLKAGDVIVQVGEEKIAGLSDWHHAMRKYRSGDVKVGIVREKRRQEVTLTLPDHEEGSMFMPDSSFNIEPFEFEWQQEEFDHLIELGPRMERLKMEMATNFAAQAEKMKETMEREGERLRQHMEELQKHLAEEWSAERL